MDYGGQQSSRNVPVDVPIIGNIGQRPFPADEFIEVRSLTLNQFRLKLVTHFDISFRKNEWPSRTGLASPNI